MSDRDAASIIAPRGNAQGTPRVSWAWIALSRLPDGLDGERLVYAWGEGRTL